MKGCLQACREACGGQGYKSDNGIAHLKADRDVMLISMSTFEAANTVILDPVQSSYLSALCKKASPTTAWTTATTTNNNSRNNYNNNSISHHYLMLIILQIPALRLSLVLSFGACSIKTITASFPSDVPSTWWR